MTSVLQALLVPNLIDIRSQMDGWSDAGVTVFIVRRRLAIVGWDFYNGRLLQHKDWQVFVIYIQETLSEFSSYAGGVLFYLQVDRCCEDILHDSLATM
jgi:hypothetical protein